MSIKKNYWEKNVKFFHCDTPEIFLAQKDNNPKFLNLLKKDKNGKEYFLEKTKHSLRLDEVTSEDIFEEQRRVVSKIDANSGLYKGIVNMLKELF